MVSRFLYYYYLGIDELDDEETRILLEKEFDDFYEDQVHKSAGNICKKLIKLV